MPYLKLIVDEINARLLAGVLKYPKFAGTKLYGISSPIIRESQKSGSNIVPGIINEKGEIVYTSIDDKYPVSAYHKVNAMTYPVDKADDFGKQGDFKTSKADMSLIVFGLSNKIKMLSYELETLLMSGFPEGMGKLNDKAVLATWQIKSLSLITTSSDMNARNIFNTEFPGANYFLKPEHILFKLNYTIESSFNKTCFATCDCPEG